MTQVFDAPLGTDRLGGIGSGGALDKLIARDIALQSSFSGVSYVSAPVDGQWCYRTDQNLMYARVNGAWLGAAFGPASATDAHFVQYDGATGKMLKDGGLSFSTDGTLGANSDVLIVSQKAIKTYVTTQIAALVDSSPATLDTLNELAAALGDDPNFAASTATAIGTKLAKSANLSDLTDAGAARSNLGLAIGTNVQAYSANLLTFAGIAPSANVQTILGAANFSAIRTALSLVPGTDVQAQNARLADIAGITFAQGDILYHNGANLVKLAAGTNGQFLKTLGAGANPAWATLPGGGDLLSTNNLSDVANPGTARGNLGLGSSDSPQFAGVNIGHATDTTLTRVSAGVIAVEGATIGVLSAAQTWSAVQTFSANAGVVLDKGSGSAELVLKSYNGGGNYGSYVSFNDVGSGGALTQLQSIANASEFRIAFGGNYYTFSPNSNGFRPSVDNSWNLGISGARWGNVYAGNGTIVTSDQNEKTALIPISDALRRAARAIVGKVGVFQWLDAVSRKGPEARLHIGPTAQIVRDAFIAEGLDPFRYSLLCADPIEEEVEGEPQIIVEDALEEVEEIFLDYEVRLDGVTQVERRRMVQRPIIDVLPVFTPDGAPLMVEAPDGEMKQATIARPRRTERTVRHKVWAPKIDPKTGEPMIRLGLRYDQLLMLICVALAGDVAE